jgi:hypothetical protein
MAIENVGKPVTFDVNQRKLSQEFSLPEKIKIDGEFVRTGDLLEIDLAKASGRNLVAGLKSGGQAIIDAGNVPVGVIQAVGGGILLPVVQIAGHLLGAGWHTLRNAGELVNTLDPIVSKMKAEGQWKANSAVVEENWNAVKAHLRAIPEADFGNFMEGLERVAKGIILTAKDLASMGKHAADALIELTGATVVGVGRGLGYVLLNTIGHPLKAIGKAVEWLGKKMVSGGKGMQVGGQALVDDAKDLYARAPQAALA